VRASFRQGNDVIDGCGLRVGRLPRKIDGFAADAARIGVAHAQNGERYGLDVRAAPSRPAGPASLGLPARAATVLFQAARVRHRLSTPLALAIGRGRLERDPIGRGFGRAGS
jgi:hypothetical protein